MKKQTEYCWDIDGVKSASTMALEEILNIH